MRSYETARTLFSFLAFCAWSVVVIGVLVALISAGGGSRYGGAGAGLLAMVPGIGISIAGLLLLAFVQMGRAGVDTAEYTQQMLKISRDQLEVSKQSLKLGDASQKSYPSRNKETKDNSQSPGYASKTAKSEKTKPDLEVPISNYGKKTSYNDHSITEANGTFYVENSEFRQMEHAKEHIDMLCEKNKLMVEIAETNGNLAEYNGKTIELSGDKFICNGIPFDTVIAARNYVDNFASVPSKVLPGVKRT